MYSSLLFKEIRVAILSVSLGIKNMKILLIILFSIFITSCSFHKEEKQNTDTLKKDTTIPHQYNITNFQEIHVIGIKGKKITFSNKESYTTNLYNLKYISQLATIKKIPYLVVEGRSCSDCDENLSIFIVSPSDGPMKPESQQGRYIYPGDENDYATNKLVFESRMFYGNSLAGIGNCVVWYQKDLNTTPQESFFIVSIKKDTIAETTLPFKQNILNKLIKNFKELKGIQVTTEP